MPEYCQLVRRMGRARARDFFDIITILESTSIDMSEPSFQRLLSTAFEAKRVPLALLSRIGEMKEFHRSDFKAVQDSARIPGRIKGYDHYFDSVIRVIQGLKPLWEE